jgi:hypothetical protein
VKSGAIKTLDNVAKMLQGVAVLTGTRVMVGVPGDKTDRDESNGITNAAIAFIQDQGAPESGIPARPFMAPGVKRAQDQTVELMKRAGQLALELKPDAVEAQLHKVGLINQAAIRSVISDGIPPPIKWSTALARIRRRKGKKYRADKRAELEANRAYLSDDQASTGIFTPLIDTAQLLKSITYVLRKVAGSKRKAA